MEQAGKASGFATQNADLYSKSIKLQKNAQETLNAELGRGAAIINGEYRMGLARATQAMTNLFKPLLPAAGFFQALGGRVLEVTGFLAKHVLIMALAVNAYQSLDVLVKKAFAAGLMEKKLPLINTSFAAMAKNMGAANVKLNSFKNVAKAAFLITKNEALGVVKVFMGLEKTTALTAKVAGKQLFTGFKKVAMGLMTATKAAWAFVATPVGVTIAAIAVAALILYKAFQMLEKETGIFSALWKDFTDYMKEASPAIQAVKSGLIAVGTVLAKSFGVVIKVVAASLAMMVRGVYTVILGFQKLSTYLPGSLGASQQAINKTRETIEKLDAAAGKLAKGALYDVATMFVGSAHAFDEGTTALQKFQAELNSANATVAKFAEAAKKAFEFSADFTPQIKLNKFKKDAAAFETSLMELQGALEDKKMTLMDAPEQTEEVRKALASTIQEIADAEEAIKGIRLKTAQETRNTKLQIVSNELEQQKMKAFSVEQEIKQMRLSAAQDSRNLAILLETQTLLEKKNLLTADAQAGISIKKAAAMQANVIELDAFRNRLNAEKQLALSAEQQKQMEIASLRSSLLQNTE